MNVSSLLPPLWHGALEYDSNALLHLDPVPSTFWLYPDQRRFHPVPDNAAILHNYLHAAEHAARANRSNRSHATLCLSMPAQTGKAHGTAGESSHPAGLCTEIALQGGLIGKLFQINKLQLRGSMHMAKTITGLILEVQHHFQLSPSCVREVEVVAGSDSELELAVLRANGFTHLQLLLRQQPSSASHASRMAGLIRLGRELQFDSVAVTLEYGCSQHTMLALARILKAVLEAGPDRITLQADRPPHPLPGWPDADSVAAARTQLCWCIRHLNAARYHYLGSLVFARSHEPLVRAQIMGRLHRDLFGYASHAENNHIGCGPGAISCLGNYYSQNHQSVTACHQQLQAGKLPLARELQLSMDDLLRRIIIHMLLCNFELSITAVELAYPISFPHYFAAELGRLKAMARRDWLVIDDEALLVLPRGRLFITQICAIFDRYPGKAKPE